MPARPKNKYTLRKHKNNSAQIGKKRTFQFAFATPPCVPQKLTQKVQKISNHQKKENLKRNSTQLQEIRTPLSRFAFAQRMEPRPPKKAMTLPCLCSNAGRQLNPKMVHHPKVLFSLEDAFRHPSLLKSLLPINILQFSCGCCTPCWKKLKSKLLNPFQERFLLHLIKRNRLHLHTLLECPILSILVQQMFSSLEKGAQQELWAPPPGLLHLICKTFKIEQVIGLVQASNLTTQKIWSPLQQEKFSENTLLLDEPTLWVMQQHEKIPLHFLQNMSNGVLLMTGCPWNI